MIVRVCIEEVLASQGGVLSMRQAVAAGIGVRTVQRRVRSGTWRQLHPRVYLVGGHRLTDEARIRAVALWAGEHGTVTGAAAGFWHGMLSQPVGPVEVTMPAALHRGARSGVRLVRRDLDRRDRTRRRGLSVAAAPLAALQTALATEDGSTFLDRALQRHVRFPQVYAAYCRMVGSVGAPAAGRLLGAAADRADSAAERLLVTLLRAAGIGGWRLGVPFGPYRIDLAFEAERVAVEVDGWAWHVDAGRFRTDRRKGNALTGAGWHLLRFTWHELTTRPHECLAEVAAALARRQGPACEI